MAHTAEVISGLRSGESGMMLLSIQMKIVKHLDAGNTERVRDYMSVLGKAGKISDLDPEIKKRAIDALRDEYVPYGPVGTDDFHIYRKADLEARLGRKL